MSKPQQPELHRSSRTPADPASAKGQVAPSRPGSKVAKGEGGPIPEDNTPGHHPPRDQDKPIEAFAAKAEELTRKVAYEREEPLRPVEPAPSPPLRGLPLQVMLPGLSLLDALVQPGDGWHQIGESRRQWVARIALLPWLGAYQYNAGVRPRLVAALRARGLTGG